jgi:hypothetical protein
MLPDIPDPENLEEQFKQLRYFEDGLFKANTFAAAVRSLPFPAHVS